MTLRNQLLSLICALFVALMAMIILISVSGTRRYLEQQLASHSQDAATAMSVTLGQSLGKGDSVLAEAHVASVFDRGYFKTIEVLGPDRVSLFKRELPEKIDGVPPWFIRLVPIETAPGEGFMSSGWRQLGKVLVVSQPTFAYQYLWNDSLKMMAWLVGICIASMAFAVVALQWILKPLIAIEDTARSVENKRFVQILLKPRAPELARVVAAMNKMSTKVGEMLDAETARASSLYAQAYVDELTGLLNRRGYELRLAELLTGDNHFTLGAVVSVEVDDMRLLSRKFGFSAGEHILRVITDSARQATGSVSLNVLARSNEFSFSFVLAEVSSDSAAAIAKTLRELVLSALKNHEPSQMVGINVGIAYFRQTDGRSEIFARADLAVESARQSGRNGFFVLPERADERVSLGSFAWRHLIQTALEENRWRLLTQPVVMLNDAKTAYQSECMARLIDVDGQLVAASNFMPMAARHQLMPDIDHAMVSLAIRKLANWPSGSGSLAVNLSPQSLAKAGFLEWFSEQLQAVGPASANLAVEVSEYGVLRNKECARAIMSVVRHHGGRFGIDHFGLDPVALSLLREIPPDYVKVSGTVVADALANTESLEILQSFVKLAHSLDVQVVAQQLEKAEQLEPMKQVGVDAAQGYLFGQPS